MGDQLRTLRTEAGLSLRDLAAQTGLSATLLSQVERGIREPSLKTLRALSTVFGSSTASLFHEQAPLTAHHSRPDERSRLLMPKGLVQYERLTPSNGQLEVLLGTLEPGQASSDEQWSHVAVECAYVITGTVTVYVADQLFEVQAGEALTFDATRPHRYTNNGREAATYLTSVTPPTP
ncbi:MULTISPECIES: helix-turn-helix domain-containing protein [unclassified Streptomyces]|uniref:helix-turn-helix domain-containing protein n=1 Tax=unclassified Streptomyces TaxID=2593676 RepID=UPI00224D0614|nr:MULTISPECIES: XRE family transcriptional regulator [unclassified Streptomyces]WSP59978.1 XRE family transcriptional regulator [Streptomyces sp. NBC_01241]WSU26610.1 XRE family transcriptional regulator [Streptomyces sp. NBC_01108]MCX4786341.1 XRE family transcriptional regulator [Streptomyces sp. NBC_01221]WSJ41206.1 XRE family transcriptional regulator [Streptomyces sp. NBC_01321]WSP67536.1 XRE family transcriptional regulator [Streptomyces sp. NBC_01240]